MNTQSYLRWEGSGVPRTGPGRGVGTNVRQYRGNEKKSQEGKNQYYLTEVWILGYRLAKLNGNRGERRGLGIIPIFGGWWRVRETRKYRRGRGRRIGGERRKERLDEGRKGRSMVWREILGMTCMTVGYFGILV